MWKRISKHFVLFCICLLFVIFVIFPYGFSRLLGRSTLNKYLKKEYYLLYEVISVKHIGYNAHANIRGIHGDRHRWWINAYECKFPFMDKTFEIWVDKRDYTIFGTDFYEVLGYDNKFQHLYSEWVKKQVGIEDENVRLFFNRAMCGSRAIGDNIHIDFDKIETLDNLEEQICQNTHNMYIRSNTHGDSGVCISINDNLKLQDVLNYADEIEMKIRPRVFIDNKHFMPNEENNLFIDIFDYNKNQLLAIMYNYDKNNKKYRQCETVEDKGWIEY